MPLTMRPTASSISRPLASSTSSRWTTAVGLAMRGRGCSVRPFEWSQQLRLCGAVRSAGSRGPLAWALSSSALGCLKRSAPMARCWPGLSCGWVLPTTSLAASFLRPLLQLLHQALQQPRARLDRREQHVFMIRMCAVAIDAEPVQRRDAHSNREIPVRSTAHARRALELEADLPCNDSGPVKHEIYPASTHERWPRDLARHDRFDVGSRRFQGLDLSFHLACSRVVAETQVHLDHAFFRDRISSGAARDQPDIRRDAASRIVQPVDRKHDLRHGNDSAATL